LRRIATPVTLPTSSAVTVKLSTLPKIKEKKIETKLNQQLPPIKHTNKPKGKQNKQKKKTSKFDSNAQWFSLQATYNETCMLYGGYTFW